MGYEPAHRLLPEGSRGTQGDAQPPAQVFWRALLFRYPCTLEGFGDIGVLSSLGLWAALPCVSGVTVIKKQNLTLSVVGIQASAQASVPAGCVGRAGRRKCKFSFCKDDSGTNADFIKMQNYFRALCLAQSLEVIYAQGWSSEGCARLPGIASSSWLVLLV